jgi:type I restriction enzyme M protein
MDQDARRRIDNARDVLVGKIPDPKAQVEQITTALIYKFMDDMDRDAQGLGGKPTFFTNGYEKYAWTHILDPRLGGQERLNRYAEALSTMSQNPHLPQLFRTIFKDAFLPYRDPTTLNLFLKEIDGFTYNHSENLGDAYEYLLSILGSQGDAGQFRTPRHIIDFMVRVVDPKKHETMLDPASGTAGFVISSYRHIIEENRDHPLTPDEKERLAGNLQGYDISPDMVRIGLVNMYLHGFPNPHIYEYDTLTSEERWDELFDICMANPPFMTPKGGIRPHKRFQIQANRSEVLFVDYIAEHLKPSGRAAVIVPEGIIFQSANAYKALRKMLVETWGLWSVVSLPAGLFQPYSGVKTSILFLDRVFAKKSDEILFAKVQNDGFDLGAQRRPIDRNDLPEVQAVLQAWHSGTKQESPSLSWVSKAKIGESGEYNLTAERYHEETVRASKFAVVALGDVCELVRGVVFAKEDEVPEGGFKVLRAGNIDKDRSALDLTDVKHVAPKADFSDDKRLRRGDIFICLASGSKDHVGKVALIQEDTDFYFGGFMGAVRVDRDSLRPEYLFRQLAAAPFNRFLREQIAGANINNLSATILYRFEIPLPSLGVQDEVIAQLDGYQRIIDGAKQVIASWRPVIPIDPSWPLIRLDQIFVEIRNGKNVGQSDEAGKYRVSRIETIATGSVDLERTKYTNDNVQENDFLRQGDILFSHINSMPHLAKTAIFDGIQERVVHGANLLRLRPDLSKVDPRYALYQLKSDTFLENARRYAQRAVNQASLNTTAIKNLVIAVPPLEVQRSIVAAIAEEEQVVKSCQGLVATYEAKISATVARFWGDGPNAGSPRAMTPKGGNSV